MRVSRGPAIVSASVGRQAPSRPPARTTSAARWVIAAAASLALACAGDSPPASASRGGPDMGELVRLYEGRDYFALRERLGEPSPDEPPGIGVLRAATAHAFNDLERSNDVLEEVLSGEASLPDSLRHEARRIRARNLVRLHRYAEAAGVFEDLVAGAPAFVDSTDVEDYRNSLRMASTLRDVPPQRVAARSATTLERVGRGEVEVTVGDSVRHYGIDTGANLSVLVRSEADALGLEVREAGLEVGTSTDVTVKADLAVADRVRMGGIELRNVVFLVVPDEMFTFPEHGLVLRGVLGFPVAEALGELRYRGGGAIEVPGEVPTREVRNLALHDLTPYVRVGWGDDRLLCALDTGNDRTMFYEPFYRRHRAAVEARGVRDTARYGGAGGVRELPGYRLDDVTLRIGGRSVTIPAAHVHTTVLTRRASSNVVDCNLGRDVLTSAEEYIFNFRSMSVLLH